MKYKEYFYKTFLLIFIFFNTIYVVIIYKFYNFKKIINFLKKFDEKHIHFNFDINTISRFQIVFFRMFKIKNCFLKSICLHKNFKNLGYKSSLCIGVLKADNVFKSHAYVYCDGYEYFSSDNQLYKNIMTIK